MAKVKVICVFKHKEDILFRVYDHGTCFFCELNWDGVDWSQFNMYERMAIAEAFKLPKQFKTIEEFRQVAKYYTGDWHFVWEGYLYG